MGCSNMKRGDIGRDGVGCFLLGCGRKEHAYSDVEW